MIAATELKLGNEGYPTDADVLVEGVRAGGDATERKLKFLRRVPVDPLTGPLSGASARTRTARPSRGADRTSTTCYSLSEGTALDGQEPRMVGDVRH